MAFVRESISRTRAELSQNRKIDSAMTEPSSLKPNNSSHSNSEPCPSTPAWANGRAALSVKDVAASCGVSAKTVRRWVSNEGLPSVRVCGAGARAMTFILPSDLDAWLQAARHESSQTKDQDQSVQIQGRRFVRKSLDK